MRAATRERESEGDFEVGRELHLLRSFLGGCGDLHDVQDAHDGQGLVLLALVARFHPVVEVAE